MKSMGLSSQEERKEIGSLSGPKREQRSVVKKFGKSTS